VRAAALVLLMLTACSRGPRASQAPSALPPGASADPAHGAYEKRVRAARKMFPKASIVVEPPFVVVGDGGREAVEDQAEGTVRWAVKMLKQDFFEKDPSRELTIWLFSTPKRYQDGSRIVVGDAAESPYGFYSPSHDALVMNISTGSGTLVHEIVHPYVEANAPGCPAWINEGLGSLFEASDERDGHIVGLVNWRLPILQKALEDKTAPSIEQVVATTDGEFYGVRGVNYAVARYVLYWLQEHGTLVGFWKDWLATRQSDPSGRKALEKALGEKLATFQPKWEKFALGLRFR